MITRRAFLGGVAATVATARRASAEPPPETSRLRLLKTSSICWAPQYVAEDLLHAEGFSDVTYVDMPPTEAISIRLAAGEADLGMNFVGPNLVRVDAGDPVVFLAGVHVGCFEAFASDRIQRIHDLKGKTVVVEALNSANHLFFATIAAHVVLVNIATDRPWSQYFCCLLTSSKEFVRKNPVATKRALRAILKAADLCAADPERAARALVDRGFTTKYEYALQTMRELPYGKWREYDPEDTIRFYALRLHEVGMIKTTPQKLIAQATDFRFFNELKRELKA